MRLQHVNKYFPVFYHSTSFILSACGCCIGKGSYRNTKHKYIIRGLGADVWFSLWFLSVCFVFYGTLSKNDHAGPTCWPDQSHRIRYFFIWSFFAAHVTCSNSEWGYRGFLSFVEIDHEIFSMVILSLPLIQEGQLSVSGERMCTTLVNRLED